MRKKNHTRVLASAALGTLVLAGLCGWNLARSAELFGHHWYYVHAVAGLLVFSAWIAASYILSLRGRGWLSRALLFLAAGGLVLSAADLIVLGFARDTSASAISWSLTHDLWKNEVLDIGPHGFWEEDLEACLSEDGCPRPIVAVIGDSFTLGQGVSDEDARFTGQLERLLWERSEIPGTVLNFGVEGAETYDQLTAILPEVAKVKPDVIVIAYLTNDIGRHADAAVQRDCLVPTSPVREVIRTSPTLNHLYYRLYRPYVVQRCGPGSYHRLIQAYRTPLRLQRHRREVAELVRESRTVAHEVVFAVLPFPAMWSGAETIRDGVHEALLATAARQGAEALSLAHIADAHSPAWFAVSPIDPHPSEAAHLAIAESLVPAVAEVLLKAHGARHAIR